MLDCQDLSGLMMGMAHGFAVRFYYHYYHFICSPVPLCFLKGRTSSKSFLHSSNIIGALGRPGRKSYCSCQTYSVRQRSNQNHGKHLLGKR